MKTKLISIFLAICMVLTLCPVSGYAASVEVSQGTALSGTEPSAQGATEAASVESTAGNTDENASESTAESTTESSEEALADGAVPDEAVSAVQAQIDALPTAEELSAIDEEAFNAAGEQIHTAHDAYTALTEAQQAEITGAECFDTLFAVLNQGVSGRLFAVLTQAAVTPAQPSGSGTAADPYQIGTEAELWWFAGVVNGTLTDGTAQNTAACARLTADIAMSADTDWIPIAPGNDITTGSVSYTGTFDGNYHSITRLSAQVVVSGDKYPDADYGMFGYVGASGAIKKLMLSANSVRGYNDVGVLCGSNYGTIENCVVSISGTAGSTGVGSDVGGVCGNSYGTVKNCIFTGSSYGISGGFYGGIVENCYYLGTSETDSRDGTTFKTAAQFASGEVAYLLNGSTSTGTLVWYQTIGTDSYPSFSGGTVYCGYYAYDSNGFKTLGYSNGNTEVGEYEAVTKDSNGVYQIANAGQLYSFVEIVNSGANSAVEINAVLTADIDINPSYTFAADGTYSGGTSPRAWTPIGNASYSNTGTFDGQNHTVSGVYINGSNNYVGLFGYNSGTVQNIKLTNSYISGKEYVGGVCGYNNGTLSGSDNTGAVSGTSYYVGGVCGYNNGTLSNSYNTGTVTGTLNSVGGVCGSNGSTMTGSHNTGTVTGTGDSVGGVCGSNETNSKISTCYNTGTVTGKNSVGGVCGSNGSTMTGSHNTGTVTGTGDSVGGVCGLTSGTLSDNYNTGIVSGKSNYVGGVCGQIFRTGTITNCYYLTGFATDGSNAKQNGVGGNIEGSSTADVAGSTTAKTAEQFASGEVCWLLNGSTATGVWKQNIDNGVTSYDASPNFTGAAVYYVNYAGSYDENGFGSPANYSNTASTNSIYEPATLNNNGTTDDATDDYYEIANAGQLYWFAEKVNQTDGSGRGLNGKLTADITVNTGDVSGCGGTKAGGWRDWTPINSYSGIFDGCGKTISGLYLSSDIGAALFGYDLFGTVKNLTLTNSYFSGGGEDTAGICRINYGTIQNCVNEATVCGTGFNIGGICGQNQGGTISGCTNRGSVTGLSHYVGGVCGSNNGSGTVENCTNSGTATGLAAVGGVCGVCGENATGCSITNCYNTGDVTGTGTAGNVGGICGLLAIGALSDCGNTGAVSGTCYIGGIAGLNGGTISSAYNTGTVSGTYYIGGIAGLNGGTVTNAYNTGVVTGSSNQVGGIAGLNESSAVITNAYYLADCAKDGDGTVQYGIGNATQGSTTADVAGSTTAKTAAQFASGEVCWLLNGSASTGVWKQNIDNGVTPYDASPNFTGAAVYYGYTAYDTNGFGSTMGYSNTALAESLYQPAALNDNSTADDATDDYYEIANAGQLYWFAEKVNQTDGSGRGLNGKLTADITVNTGDVSGCGGTKAGGWRDWTPINSYSGIFDGCGKTISGLYLSSDIGVALFGYGMFGTVKNLTLTNSYFSGGEDTAGICGINNGTIQNCVNEATVCGTGFNIGGICDQNQGGTISGCTNRGSVTGLSYYVGGVCGNNTSNGEGIGGTIENCTNSGTVTGSAGVGGICGDNEGGDSNITNCNNTGDVVGTGTDGNVGGICGYFEKGALSNCGNTGAVSGTRYIGGIAGLNSGTIGTISSAYNTGAVSGTYYIGGIAGYNSATISSAYNTGTVTGSSNQVGGIAGYNSGTISSAYNTGVVTGSSNQVGGIAGLNESSAVITNAYYLADCAKDGDGTVQYGIGNATQGSTTADVAGSTTAKTAAQFASGEVCWLLNGSASTGVWKQNIDNGVTPYDASPNFTSAAVYYGYTAYDTNGFGSTMGYSNTALEMSEYQPAALNDNSTADDATDDYYEIANAGQLCWFAAKVNAGDTAISGKLTADIDLNGVTWSGIGNASNTFSGTFDGGGFAISNMNSAKTNQSPGLIYALGTNGVVKNLTMKSAFTFDQNGQNKGIVVGANSGSIEAVFVTDSQITMGNYDGMGGIAGKNTGTISNCGVVNVTFTRVWGAVDGNKVSGAITENNTGTVSNCYSYGITFTGGTDANAGVLVATGTAPVNSYYLSTDISTDKKVVAGVGGTAATAAQFASGEVCWLLNGSTATGVWKQNIDNGVTPDASPNFTGATVYYGCNDYDENGFGSTMRYSNTALAESLYQPATLNNNGTADNTTDDYYEITNAGQLYWFAEKANANLRAEGLNGRLTADITVNTGDVSGCGGTKADGWRVWTQINTYSGVFDGCGKTISGLYLVSEAVCVGLFGYGMFGTVKNLTLTNSYFSGGEGTGGICGISQGTIQNCVNEATVVTGTDIFHAGGICGRNQGGTISGCTNRGSVTSLGLYVGGICGTSEKGTDSVGTVENCTNSGTVTGSYVVGGICGSSENSGNITNCYNTGDVVGTGTDGYVGGICGLLGSGALSSCCNTGAVSGTCSIGGIAGLNGGTISSAYNTGVVTGSGYQVGGIAGLNSGTVTNAYYLEGCAKDGGGTAQNGIGNATQGSTTADVAGSTTVKTAEQFASGEVCWLLNGSTSTGVWKQDIDNDVTPYDASPNFTGAAVYYLGSQSKYTNNAAGEIVSVDITWGAMEFTYSDGTWNAATHQYDGAGWTAAEGGNAVTVKNSGTAAVTATVSYTQAEDYIGITGSFDSDVTAAIAINEEKKWLLSLSGKPAEAMSNIKLGTVTVTIGGE